MQRALQVNAMSYSATYIDHNASAPLLPEARDAMLAAFDLVGNPSSVHGHGRALRTLVEAGRDQVARAAGAKRGEVVFTGSATESLTQGICGGARAFAVDEVVISAGEHVAALRAAEMCGVPVTRIGLSGDGVVDVAGLRQRAAELSAANRRGLFVVHWVNNETGVAQPLAEIETLLGPTPHVLLVDAVQAFGKLPTGFSERPADMMAISSHKVGGPAGIGALLMKPHCDQVRLVPGGGQELGRRGGTEAWGLIAGFGAAACVFAEKYAKAGVSDLASSVENELKVRVPDVVVFGEAAQRIGGVSNFAVPGLGAAVAMMGLDLEMVSVSSGSACSSGKVGSSHVLAAMGIAPDLAGCALRVSFGWNSRQEDVTVFLAAFDKIMARHQKAQGAAA